MMCEKYRDFFGVQLFYLLYRTAISRLNALRWIIIYMNCGKSTIGTEDRNLVNSRNSTAVFRVVAVLSFLGVARYIDMCIHIYNYTYYVTYNMYRHTDSPHPYIPTAYRSKFARHFHRNSRDTWTKSQELLTKYAP